MSACVAYGCKNRAHDKIRGITFHKFPKDIALRNKWLVALRRANFRPSKYSHLCSEHFSENLIDRTSLACVRLRANAVPNIFNGFPKDLQEKLKLQSSTNNESKMELNKKCIIKQECEDSMSDEGLNRPEETITHTDISEQVNCPDSFHNDKNSISESINGSNTNELPGHPKIVRIISVSKDVPFSSLFSASSLNPDVIDNLTASCQVENSSDTPNSSDAAASMQSNHSSEVILKRKVQELEIMNSNYRKKIKILQQQTRRQRVKIDTLKNRIRELEACRTPDEDISEDGISENEIYEELLKHQIENEEDSS